MKLLLEIVDLVDEVGVFCRSRLLFTVFATAPFDLGKEVSELLVNGIALGLVGVALGVDSVKLCLHQAEFFAMFFVLVLDRISLFCDRSALVA